MRHNELGTTAVITARTATRTVVMDMATAITELDDITIRTIVIRQGDDIIEAAAATGARRDR